MNIHSEDIPSLSAVVKACHYEFAGKSSDYCVCVFVINEGERLIAQMKKMAHFASLVDIVIADGGSTDGSTDLELLQANKINSLLVKQQSGKLGTQMRMAFAWALERGYKGLIVVDGNNKDGIEALPLFVEKLQQGWDHIQGSRFIPGGHQENTPFSRLLGLKLLHAPLMRLVSGFRYTDTTNGFRAYSTRLLIDKKLSIFRDIFTGYELHYYIALRAPQLGYKCIEVPVSRVYPAHGKVPTKISPIRGNLQVIQKLFAVVFGCYNPKKVSNGR